MPIDKTIEDGPANEPKGFSYDVSADRIRWWRSVPPQQKLEWLEEANEFLRKALTPEKKRIVELFRKGII